MSRISGYLRAERARVALRRGRVVAWWLRALLWAAGFVGLGVAYAMLCGCSWRVPVATAPAKDAQGQAVPAPVLVLPQTSAEGKPIPIPVVVVEPIPVAKDERFDDALAQAAPVPEPAPGWGWMETLLTTALGALGLSGAGWAVRMIGMVGKFRTALALTANLADQVADAPDDEAVKKAKQSGQAAQLAAGVHGLIQRVRGKV